MSYCRKNEVDSDVYVYPSEIGIECCACSIVSDHEWAFRTDSRLAMITHLEAHRTAGHKVPESVIDQLLAEFREVGR